MNNSQLNDIPSIYKKIRIFNSPTTSNYYGRIVFYIRNLVWQKTVVYKLMGTHLLEDKKPTLLNLLPRREV